MCIRRRLLFGVLALISCAAPLFAQTRVYELQAPLFRVLDGETFETLAMIDLTAYGNPSGVAITNDSGRAFVGLGGSFAFGVPGQTPPKSTPRVAVIDLFRYTVIRIIDVGNDPVDVVAHSSGERVYVANSADKTVSVIRTSDYAVIATIPVPISASVLAMSKDDSKLYATGGSPSTPVVVEIDTTALVITASFAAPGCPAGLAVSPNGARLYVSGICAGGPALWEYDISSRTRTAAVGPAKMSRLAVTPDGSKLVAGGGDNLANTSVWDTATMTEIGSAKPSGTYVAIDPSGSRAYTWGFWGNTSPNVGTTQLNALDLTTYTVTRTRSEGQVSATGLAVTTLPPCRIFRVTPSYSGVTLSGGGGSFSAPVPVGCPWLVESSDPWLTITSVWSGSGPATITYSAAPAAAARTAELRINGQILPVYQTAPQLFIETPASNAHTVQGFHVAGWAGEAALPGSATLTLANPRLVHLWAYPAGGGAPIFIGQTNASIDRPDVAAYFPPQQSGGFDFLVSGLTPGTYTFVAYLFSPYVNAFAAAQTVTVTIDARTFTVIDTLQGGASVTVPFRLGGWAVDASAASRTGVDAVNVYAYPDAGGAPIFAGSAFYGLTRTDLIPFFGTNFRDSGFGLAVDGLAPGGYTMVAYAHSTVTGRFEPAVVHVMVTGAAEPLEIETFGIPPGGTAIFVTGWAIDRRASSGTGVTAIQAWAYPASGAAPIFLASAQMPFARPDIASIYGARYRDSGWTLGGQLPSGSYQIVFYALSAATGKFDNVRVRSLIVP